MMGRLQFLLILIPAALLLRRFVVCFSLIRGRSMLSTLKNNDVVLVSRWRFLLRRPRRGEVVICFFPGRRIKHFPRLRQPMIKRVIALPGETIEIVEGQTLINGAPLEEAYLDPAYQRFRRNMDPVVLSDREYFVMGDNRDSSLDSRRVGALDRSMLSGCVQLRLWPPRRWGRIR